MFFIPVRLDSIKSDADSINKIYEQFHRCRKNRKYSPEVV